MRSAAPSTSPATPVAGAKLRSVTQDDVGGVMRLFERHGWPLRSPAGWVWALFENPARRASGADSGWVLESDGVVVGFLGNIPAQFCVDGRPVLAATCTSLLVDELHRGRGMALVRAFTAQPGVAWVYSATANANSAPVYKAFSYRPCDDIQANQRLRWFTSKSALARAVLERVHLGWLLPSRKVLQHVHDCRGSLHRVEVERIRHHDLVGVDGRALRTAWECLSRALAAQAGLQSDRSVETMAWRLADPDMGLDEIALWALRESDGRMLGMALARRLPRQHGRPSKAELIDLSVLPECGTAEVEALLQTVLAWAKSNRVAVLDAKRWTGKTAETLAGLGARVHELPQGALWMRAGSASEQALGVDWLSWAMTGLDSDDWFNTLRTSQPSEPAEPCSPAVQPDKAELSDATKSSMVSTSEGSNRSMSTV